MYYIIYLAGVILLVSLPATFFQGYINLSMLLYFLDYPLLILILLISSLILFCTRLFKPFLSSFLFMFGKKKLTQQECKQSLLSIKTVTSVSIAYGILYSLIQLINLLCTLNLIDSTSSLSALGVTIHLSMLSFSYALLIYIILLPIRISLNKQIVEN